MTDRRLRRLPRTFLAPAVAKMPGRRMRAALRAIRPSPASAPSTDAAPPVAANGAPSMDATPPVVAQMSGPRMRTVLRAIIVSTAAAAVIAAPSAAAAAPSASADPYALTPDLAHVARVVKSTRAMAEPGSGRTVMRVSPLAEWGGGEVQYLVLRSAERGGHRWLQVRLPERPNGAAGWIRADLARVSTTPWRIHVETGASRVTVERAGQVVKRFAAVVGKPSTPTPRGLFAVDEPIRQPAGSELGPWALFLTAHSRVLEDYGGGPGRIAIHGRDGPLLADPLGTHASHGCVRVADREVRWLHRVAVDGTPVQITR